VVVGGGPTGVELAGQLAEIAYDALRQDFRRIDPRDAKEMLFEAADRILPPYAPAFSAKATRSLERLGVSPMLNTMVVGMDWESVTVSVRGGEPERIPARTKIWAAGVQTSPLAQALASATGADIDRAGRITVEPDLTLPGHPEVFVIGDMNRVSDGAGGLQPWPGTAPPAIQERRYAASAIKALADGERMAKPFGYKDKGSLATIGRFHAVADIRGVRFAGAPAWLTWLLVHIMSLVGLHNRFVVMMHWASSFVSRQRSQRLITGESVAADFEQTVTRIEQPVVQGPAS
jgi:NADH:quinone reductase (non-electrogenic)